MTSEAPRAAVWARVSTTDQHTANQLGQLREWAARRGLDIAAEHVTEDSAWASGNGNGKGAEFDRQRRELLDGARLGHYNVVLVWALDRLSRKGIEDTLATLRQLAGYGCTVWSHQEPWVQSMTDPAMRELLVSLFAWMAEQESRRRSERIKAGLARRKAEGHPVGGRKPGAKDKRRRATGGYHAAWAEGGARRGAQQR
jgi:DNA invertase Pin-like site-specific DNA recombinase